MTPLAAVLFLSTPSATAQGVQAELERIQQDRHAAELDGSEYAESPYERPQDLPLTVEIETHYQAFNDYYYFALVDGRVYYKPRFKRGAGQPEWRLEQYAWKPLGHNGGLPYQLDHKNPEDLDTTWADGDRNGFVDPEMVFADATVDQHDAYIDATGWELASTWLHDAPPVFDPEFPVPERIVAITADDDELAVLGDNRQMYYRRKYANIFVSQEWYQGWGQSKDLPVYFPAHITGHKGWALGRVTAFGAGYKEGPDGRIFEWGPAAVSMETMVWLSADGTVIYYLDSGTPPVVEHFVEAPLRGQYRAEAINSSASTVMLLDRFGAVQTKIADFDLLGSTPTHPYCYDEACDDEVFYPPGDIRSGMSDIRLPPEDWAQHAPILPASEWGPDTWITTRIGIHQTGRGNAARELRVVGSYRGEIGTFHKSMDETRWHFRAAPADDRGFHDIQASEILDVLDVIQYESAADLVPLHADNPRIDRELIGKVELDGGTSVDLVVHDYNPRASPWNVTLTWQGVELPMQLHVVQAWNPYVSPEHHAQTWDRQVVTWEGTLGYDRAELERAIATQVNSRQGRAVRKVLARAENEAFTLIINANEFGFEAETKSTRRTGPFRAVALVPDAITAESELDALSYAFWDLQEGQMGWSTSVAELGAAPDTEGCTAERVEWAAHVLLLQEQVKHDTTEIRKTKGQARRFSWFTFGTAGTLYLLQVKTIDAVLDGTREWRSARVRPNELRFNVVTGVTTRIPYLAGNIADVERARLEAVRREAHAVKPELSPLVDAAQDIAALCP
jgi:hypothetical protein